MLGKMTQGGAQIGPLTGLTDNLVDSGPSIYIAGFSSLPTAEATILAILAGIVTWAAISDLTSTRIPNTASAAILALWIGWAVINPSVAVLFSLGIGAALFAAGAALFHHNLMGGGDVKFMAALGLFAGPQEVIPFLLYVSIFGGALSLLGLLLARHPVPVISLVSTTHGKRTVPYGVAIAAGAYILIATLWSA
jgi:prepilin peptidase CpaA